MTTDQAAATQAVTQAESRSRKTLLALALLCFLGILGFSSYLIWQNNDIKKNGPTCDNTAECDAGLYCVSGHCKGECNNTSQCEGTQICNGGKCVNPGDPSKQCQLASDCGILEVCDNGTCKPKPCSEEGDCNAPGYFCLDGVCRSKNYTEKAKDYLLYAIIGGLIVIFSLAVFLFFFRNLARFFAISNYIWWIAVGFLVVGIALVAWYFAGDGTADQIGPETEKQFNQRIQRESLKLYFGIGFIVLALVMFFIRRYGASSYIDDALKDEKDFDEAYDNASDEQKETLKQLWLNRQSVGDDEAYAQFNSYVDWINNRQPGAVGSFFGFGTSEEEALNGKDFSQTERFDPTIDTEGFRKFKDRYYTMGNHIATQDQIGRSTEGKGYFAAFTTKVSNAFSLAPNYSSSKRAELMDYKDRQQNNRRRFFQPGGAD